MVLCCALLNSSLGNDDAKPETQAWDGLSYEDPKRPLKIFSYVFSIYLGVEMCDIRPRSKFAYGVRIVILFCRMLFVLHVAKNIFFIMADSVHNSHKADAGRILVDYITEQVEKAKSLRNVDPHATHALKSIEVEKLGGRLLRK